MDNQEFLKSMFRKYYLSEDITLPPRFTRREFGFMFFDKKYVLRHVSFRNRKELQRFLVDNVPRHAYYSTAYYLYPQIKDMEKKGWLGADLVFDLDADHIPETEGMEYENMLKIVKREAEKLVFRYLIEDFGFSENDVEITFSGGRGYHIYVRRDAVLSLGSNERREIVSYITGESADITKFLRIEREKIGRRSRTKYILYPPNFGGWYGKLSREISRISRELIDLYEKHGEMAVSEEIASVLKDKKLAKKLTMELFKQSTAGTMKIEYLLPEEESQKLQIFERDALRDLFLRYIKEKIRIRGETDEPVTTDIHRLIRLIGSLHGKTGFKVKKLSIEEFKEFNPLIDAIPETFENKYSKIKVKSKFSINMRGERYKIENEDCVPDYVAVFIVARGLGDFIARCS